MTSEAKNRAGVVRRLRHLDVPVDNLNLRGAVLADGLMLRVHDAGGVTLHSLDGGRARLLGSFATAAEAWRALDELDAPEALEQAA